MKICKNTIILALGAFVLITACPVLAVQKGHLQYGSPLFDYSKLNKDKVRAEAEYYFNAAYLSDYDKETYLNTAMGKYYLLTQIDPSMITPYIQLARIYDETNKNSLAKQHFFHALNLNPHNPYANFYFGEFYYKRRDYKRALKYYRTAYNNGFNGNFDINYRLGEIYEKFADLENAGHFYGISYSLNPNASEISQKIQSINGLNYGSSQYYHFIRE